jgi:hypothetical protein
MSGHVMKRHSEVSGWLSWRQFAAPVAVLVLLSPVLTELLMGALRITNLWLLIPEMGVYGVGALLIREVARRRQRGWGTILLLGIALAILIECVILQTSLTPQFFSPAGEHSFGWAYGVQWIYLLAMLGYESVYAVVIPIQLTELLFPDRRNEPWLNRGAAVIAGAIFLLASVAASLLWSNQGLARYGESTYRVPAIVVALALVAVVALSAVALSLASRPSATTSSRRARSPWLVGVLAFVFGLLWWLMVVFSHLDQAMVPGLSPLVPIVAGLLWGGLAYVIVRRLSSAADWQDTHRLALIFGASVASMVGGALSIITAGPVDRLGKLIVDLIAVILFSILASRLRRQSRSAHTHSAA